MARIEQPQIPASEVAIYGEHVTKEYQLGVLGATTLVRAMQSRMAKARGKEDPNHKVFWDGPPQGIVRAVDDVSFVVRKGDRVGLIGHNGAGKSTLLKLICRITAPTEGFIGYNGRVTSMLEVGTGFHPELTGRENVYMNGAILGMTRAQIDKRMDEIVEFSEVGKYIDTPVKRYSSGMYVRLAFSVSAHLDADIVIMDEVLAVGDASFQEKCIQRMREIAAAENRTIIYVSHNMGTVRALCDRSIVLEEGRIVFDGSVSEGEHIYLTGKGSTTERDYTDRFGRPDLEMPHDAVILGAAYETEGNVVDKELAVNLRWRYERQLDDLHARVEIRNGEGTAIASKNFWDLGGGAPGTEREARLSLDIHQLRNGDYHTTYVLYRVGDAGSSIIMDRVDGLDVVIRDPERDKRMLWHSDWWGPIEL